MTVTLAELLAELPPPTERELEADLIRAALAVRQLLLDQEAMGVPSRDRNSALMQRISARDRAVDALAKFREEAGKESPTR